MLTILVAGATIVAVTVVIAAVVHTRRQANTRAWLRRRRIIHTYELRRMGLM